MKSICQLIIAGIYLVDQASAVSSGTSRAYALDQLHHIEQLTYNLSYAIGNWTGTGDVLASALKEIHTPADFIAKYLVNVTRDLKSYETTYDLTDAFRLAGATQDLAYAVNISVAQLNIKEPLLTKNYVGPIVQGDVMALINSTVRFADQLIDFVPEYLRPVALNLKSQAVDSLYMGYHCSNGTGQAKQEACVTISVDPQLTHKMALRWGAIKPNGFPIA